MALELAPETVCRCGEYETCEVCIEQHRRTREAYKSDTDPIPPPATPSDRWPTLVAIGLVDALDEVESVAAGNQGKHPGRKWVTKSISHHDAKAIKHLGTVQCGQPFDADTGKRGRAHAALRLLMALGLELMRGR
jgi:hypothetical protein